MIGMYDSGLGGLSIWQAVVASIPMQSITYLADQAYCPYGRRTRAEITTRTVKIARYLIDRGASMLVLACNTATSNAITILRREVSIPIVGVEPAIKPAVAASRSGRIGVLATPATLRSEGLTSLVQRFGGGVDILLRPALGWVELVEAGDLNSERARHIVGQEVAPLLLEEVDHIVLGCTHYLFLLPLIREIIDEDIITLSHPATAVARRVVSLLEAQCGATQPQPYYRFLTTAADSSAMATRLPALIGQVHPVESITLG